VLIIKKEKRKTLLIKTAFLSIKAGEQRVFVQRHLAAFDSPVETVRVVWGSGVELPPMSGSSSVLRPSLRQRRGTNLGKGLLRCLGEGL